MRLRFEKRSRALVGTAIGGILLLVAATTATAVAVAGDQSVRSPSAATVTTDDTDDKDASLVTSVENPEELAQQEKLDSYVDPLLNSGLLEAADNFGGAAVDYDDFAFDMWWNGEVPSDVQSVLDDFGDVEVRLHEAKFTAQEIEAAAKDVAKYSSDQFDVVTVTLEDLNRPTTLYGIEVEVTKHGDKSDAAIAAELTQAAGLPVSVNPDLASTPATRANDSSPYWAGGVLDAPTLCTTGFAVKKDGGGRC